MKEHAFQWTIEINRRSMLIENIAIKNQKRNVIQGWSNKPKGGLQIICERGFIDPTKEITCHAMEGKRMTLIML